MSLQGKTVMITGGGVRLGRAMVWSIAHQGGHILLHYNRSHQQAEELQSEIQKLGGQAHLVQADLANADSTLDLIDQISSYKPLYALINSASIFAPIDLSSTTLDDWETHFRVNLTAPFLLCKAFPSLIEPGGSGRIINILDWRALRPGKDHLPYTISKAALTALTQSLAVELAPNITVNGLAFGAILPPSDGGDTDRILENVPAERWAHLEEVGEALLFLLEGPEYITGEIIHLDGGRHLI
jgi:NAD(P)-dependent dehydrogenase (short-subunit alcohol dehydrogenase family)